MAQLDNDAVQFERHAVRLEVVRTEVVDIIRCRT